MTALRAAGSTDAGQVRAQNQDTFFVSDDLALIADGMGGYAGGEVAAAIAAEVVEQRFAANATAGGLEDAVLDANRAIFERGVEPGLEGMGTTLVAVAVVEKDGSQRLLFANVGDSRCYLLRDGTLRQLTEDHSVAAELVRMGRIDEDEGAEHPGRHVLTRALGVDRDVEPDLIELDPLGGDRLLLCSDGLSNELVDDEIVALLAVGAPSDAARALVAAANAHGGLDNITAVVADVVDVPVQDADSHTTSVAVVAPAAAAAAGVTAAAPSRASSVTSVADVPALTLRPVLTARQRRRRRREDRRERRAWNKWVSLRGVVFVLAFAVVLACGFVVLRWYGTSNYIVATRANHIVIIQGRAGGFLWWSPKVVVIERFGTRQMPLSIRASLRDGVNEPSIGDARAFVAAQHLQWQTVTHHLPTTTTTTTTTTTLALPTGGT